MVNIQKPLVKQLESLWYCIDGLQNSGGAGGPHIHPISDVTGLQAALDGKQPSGSYSLTAHNHDGAYQPIGDYADEDHGHVIAEVSGLQTALDGKQAAGSYSLSSHNHDGDYAAVDHDHAIADITGLQTALDGKQASGSYAASNHNHDGVYQPVGSYLTSITSGNVTTALGYTPTSVTGLTGAQSVAAFKTGLSLAKGDVGLGSVDNTADSEKVVLSATKLTTARNINGVAFDGTGNITINAVDSTARVAEARTISTTAPLTGGGDLSGNRTLAISAATSGAAGSMSAADKAKLDAITGTNTGDQTSVSGNAGTATALATPRTISITGKATAAGGSFDGTGNLAINVTAVSLVAGDIPAIAESGVTNLVSDLAAKAPLAAPALTGAVTTTGSLGFASGAGGAQTQSPNKTSAVTLNKAHGLITMSNAALAAATVVSHTLTNSQIAATDQVICSHVSGGTSGAYTINAFPGAGSAVISVRNNTAGSLSEAIVYRFTVIKGVNA